MIYIIMVIAIVFGADIGIKILSALRQKLNKQRTLLKKIKWTTNKK